MRPLEILIPVLLIVYLIWKHPRPVYIRLMPVLAVVVNVMHLAVEGYRWQMIPLYILTPLIAISSLTKIFGAKDWKPRASFLKCGFGCARDGYPYSVANSAHPCSQWTFSGGNPKF